MSEMPKVEPGTWVTIGSGRGIDAVVCVVHKDRVLGDIEVVYIDQMKRAINEEAIWEGDHWEFKHAGPNGGYADKYDRLRDYVTILRRGHY